MPAPVYPSNKYSQWAANRVTNHAAIQLQFTYAAQALFSATVADFTKDRYTYYYTDPDLGLPSIRYNGSQISDLSSGEQEAAMAGLDAFFSTALATLYP